MGRSAGDKDQDTIFLARNFSNPSSFASFAAQKKTFVTFGKK